MGFTLFQKVFTAWNPKEDINKWINIFFNNFSFKIGEVISSHFMKITYIYGDSFFRFTNLKYVNNNKSCKSIF